MVCPACAYDNLVGADVCDNCGSELTGGVPQQANTFQGHLLGVRLGDLPIGQPETIDASADAYEAIARMHRDGIDCLLVVEGGRLVGVFTDRDAVLKVAGREGGSIVIRDVMTPDPVVLRHDDSIAIAIHKMAVGGFRHVPILANGTPTGVISAKVIFQHLADHLA